MSVFYTPSDQFIYVSPYFQNRFNFGTGTKDDVRICRYLNNILKLFGEDIIISGGNPQSHSVNSNTINISINEGKLIQDMTLIEFSDFSLDKTVTGHFGDNANIVAESTSNVINTSPYFTATYSGDTVTVTDITVGSHGNTVDGNTGFDFTIVQDGVTSVSEISQIHCSAGNLLSGGEYFLLNSVTDGYYCWYSVGTLNEKIKIDYSGGLAGGEYFFISSPATDYYVWYRVSGGGTDPVIPNKTSIVVDILSGNTPSAVQAATDLVINNHLDFEVTLSGSGFSEIMCSFKGETIDSTSETSSFIITILNQGTTIGVDPNIPSKTGIPIFVQDDDISYNIAQKTAQILGLNSDFNTSFSTNITTIENIIPGSVDDIIDGDTNFSFVVHTQGITGLHEIVEIKCKNSWEFDPGSYFLLNSLLQNFYVWYDSNDSAVDPNIVGRAGLSISHKRSSIVVIYTDFQYSSDDRDVSVDPCTFFFKIGLVNPISHDFIGPTWNINKNRIMICAYDLDKGIFLNELNIDGIIYKKLGLNGNYNYFKILDGGLI